MAKDDLAQLEGKVIDAAAGGLYVVKLENDVDKTKESETDKLNKIIDAG